MVARSILRDSASIVVDNATELASFEQWHDTRRSMTNVINMASVPPINMAGVPPKRRKPLFEPKIMMISSVKQSFEAMTELGIYALGGQNQEAVARGFCNCEVREYVVCLEDYYSVTLLPYSISSGVLEALNFFYYVL